MDKLHDFLQQRYGPMPVIVHHTAKKEKEAMKPQYVEANAIRQVIKNLEADLTYMGNYQGDHSRGYRKAAGTAIKHLERLLPPKPQHEEAWLLRIKRDDGRTFETVALRNEEGKNWEDLDEIYADDSDYYEIELLHKLEPKKG